MSYRRYTSEFKRDVVEEFLDSGIPFYTYCKEIGLNPRTFRYWVEYDGRHAFKTKLRIQTRTVFPFTVKREAAKLRLSGILLKDIANKFGTTKMTIAKWTKTYQEKGEYALMGKKDKDDDSLSTESSLRRENELLKAQLQQAQMERDICIVVGDMLKKWTALSLRKHLKDLKNLQKTRAILKLKAEYNYKYTQTIKLFGISRNTFNKSKKSVKLNLGWENRHKEKHDDILSYITSNPNIHLKEGRETITLMMKNDGHDVSDRQVKAVMQANNLQMRQTKSGKTHNSYKNDGQPPAPNYLFGKVFNEETGKAEYRHFFKPQAPWMIMGGDVTEFHINDFKLFLSMNIDFFDSAPAAWRMSQHPDTDLIVGSVEDLNNKKPDGASFVLHFDQGSVNRSVSMKNTCDENHILLSNSRKAKSGDNAPCEGFFGRMKQSFLYKTDFTGYTYEMFAQALEDWLNYYVNERPKKKLGGMSPNQYRDVLYLKKTA